MSEGSTGKEKVERDYLDLKKCVKSIADEEIDKMGNKMEALKKEASKVGETVEAEISNSKPASPKKKS